MRLPNPAPVRHERFVRGSAARHDPTLPVSMDQERIDPARARVTLAGLTIARLAPEADRRVPDRGHGSPLRKPVASDGLPHARLGTAT